MVYKETDSSYGEENQERPLEQSNRIDWEKAIGMGIISKDNLDMGRLIADPHKDYATSHLIIIEYGDHQRCLKFQKKLYTKWISKTCIQH